MAEQKIIVGNCVDKLKEMDAQSVHCVVTSPPYWSLRDYGNTDGGIGLEHSFETYLGSIARVFKEVRRVLRDDGTLWLNMGDSYSGSGKGPATTAMQQSNSQSSGLSGKCVDHVPVKNLIGQPWHVAFLLQARGWILRSDIIWHKLNPMPESVQDRPTKGHEYIFLFAKTPMYFYDINATREASKSTSDTYETGEGDYNKQHKPGARKLEQGYGNRRAPERRLNHPLGKNLRTVWSLSSQPYAGAHFATFPESLVERCLKAGTSEKGACSRCGIQWNRKVDRDRVPTRPDATSKADGATRLESGNVDHGLHVTNVTHTGWASRCGCGDETVPPLVLDPFSGAGTVGVVCKRMGLDYIGIEINPKYAEMSERRIRNPEAKPVDLVQGQELLFDFK